MMGILRDLGERSIIREILPKYVTGVGDDCAVLDVGDQSIVVTTDPVPEPAAKVIAGDSDLYWMGWLLVTINASDLAAAGATPLGFLSAIDCPADLQTALFERLLAGIRDACAVEGLPYVGGNLREASRISAVGTAVGRVRGKRPLSRFGAAPGDLVVSIGAGGIFWRDALLVRDHNINVDKTRSPLFSPRSQLPFVTALHEQDCIRAAMDNSDGLLATLNQLAAVNNCRFNLFTDLLDVQGADEVGVSPVRLWLGWGDWNVVAIMSEAKYDLAKKIAHEHLFSIANIGRVEHGQAGVVITSAGQVRVAPRLESERFASDSWFATGIDGYIELLKSADVD